MNERPELLFKSDVAEELDVGRRTALRYMQESGVAFQVGSGDYWAIYREDLSILRDMRDERRRRNPTTKNGKNQ